MKNTSLTLIASALVFAGSIHGAPGGPDYIAHEWGTFTSVQGSNGGLIHWNPFESTDLPEFVLTREKPCPFTPEQLRLFRLQGLGVKNSSHWLQRMETPVIYFYAKEDFEVDVDVAFPKGLITEWYPAVSSFGPAAGLNMKKEVSRRNHTAWKNLLVLGGAGNPTRVPKADVPSHYFTARTDDASSVRVQNALHPKQIGQEEQFLFYRGAGNFETPLHVSMKNNDALNLKNRGKSPIGRLFVYQHDNNGALFQEVDGLDVGEQATVRLEGMSADALPERLITALVSEGLYQSEAEAMVNTWRRDWLGDRGIRVLYLLSQKWTDEMLPLKLDPAPREVVRVMVGRAEVFSPEIEMTFDLALSEQMKNLSNQNLNGLQNQLEPRFLEPAVTGAVNRQVAGIEKQSFEKKEAMIRKNEVHKAGGVLKILLDISAQSLAEESHEVKNQKLASSAIENEIGVPWVAPESLFDCRGSFYTGVSGNNAE